MRDMNHSMRKTFAECETCSKGNCFISKPTPNGPGTGVGKGHIFTRPADQKPSIYKGCPVPPEGTAVNGSGPTRSNQRSSGGGGCLPESNLPQVQGPVQQSIILLR